MRNVVAGWIEGARVRMEGAGASRLLGRSAMALATAVNLSVAVGGAVLVSAAPEAPAAASSLPVRGHVDWREFVAARGGDGEAALREIAVGGAEVTAVEPDVDPASEERLPPDDEIVRIAARVMEIQFGDPRAAEAFKATVEAASGCYEGPIRPEGCRIVAPGVDFDMGAGTYFVGVDPETGMTADVDGNGVIAIQSDGELAVDDELVANLDRDVEDFLQASVRAPGR